MLAKLNNWLLYYITNCTLNYCTEVKANYKKYNLGNIYFV